MNDNPIEGVAASHASVDVKVVNPILQKSARRVDITNQVLLGKFDDKIRNRATIKIQMDNLDKSV